ncbi:MAG: hypothetical protein QOG77_1711, partial [Solirubrobacteraceae bacterium]|nr:hypothetical protein [Solirubrobacteraceae bacterium]
SATPQEWNGARAGPVLVPGRAARGRRVLDRGSPRLASTPFRSFSSRSAPSSSLSRGCRRRSSGENATSGNCSAAWVGADGRVRLPSITALRPTRRYCSAARAGPPPRADSIARATLGMRTGPGHHGKLHGPRDGAAPDDVVRTRLLSSVTGSRPRGVGGGTTAAHAPVAASQANAGSATVTDPSDCITLAAATAGSASRKRLPTICAPFPSATPGSASALTHTTLRM